MNPSPTGHLCNSGQRRFYQKNIYPLSIGWPSVTSWDLIPLVNRIWSSLFNTYLLGDSAWLYSFILFWNKHINRKYNIFVNYIKFTSVFVFIRHPGIKSKMRRFHCVGSLKVIYKLLPALQFPRRASFVKSENDLAKYRSLPCRRLKASRRAMSIEFKSYANVMDNKKFNAIDKYSPREMIIQTVYFCFT